jgi:hypothetical protein
MRTMLRAVAFAAALPLVAPALGAQMPGPGHGPAVTFLLSQTGQLQLTDQQVVKLAAIARRAAERHKAMHASFDSLRAQFRAAMEKERDANHADLRDALAVLTTDQQASAWELVSRRHAIRLHHMGPSRGDGPVMRSRAGKDDDQIQIDDEG